MMKNIILILIFAVIIIGAILTTFYYLKVSFEKPKIVHLKEPIQFIGLSIKTNNKTVSKDIPILGKKYKQITESTKIPNKKEPWAFVAASKDYDKVSGNFEYIMGDVVTNVDLVPDGLDSYTIPAMTYAVFTIKPKNKFLWGITISKTKQYIYNQWLPNSKYESAGTIDDFEYHDERSTREKHPEIHLYVAIKEKGK